MLPIVDFLIFFLTMAFINSILTLSLNLEYGFCGLINFGQVGFFMIGAYASALLALNGFPFPVYMILAGVIAGAAGIVFSLPTAKLGVNYWAIIMLGGAEVIRLVILNEEWISGKSAYEGIANVPKIVAFIPSQYYGLFFLLFTIFILALFYIISNMLINSPFGRIIKTIRDGEDLPQSLGLDVRYYKVVTMALGSMMAGVAGSLYAHFLNYVTPYVFLPGITFLIWTMLIIGGTGNLFGSIVGTITVSSIHTSTRFIKDYIPIDPAQLAYGRMIVIGIILILVLIYRKEGIFKEKPRLFQVSSNS